MKVHNLKIQITIMLIFILFMSMFMLSCVWVMLSTKALVEKEIVLIAVFADSVAKDVHDGEIVCYQIENRGEGRVLPELTGCPPGEEDKERGEVERISYRGTQWAVLTFSHKILVLTKSVLAENGTEKGTVIIESQLEPIYEKIRDDWKIVIYYLLINVIIFTSIGFFRMYRLVFRPIDRLVDISEKFSPDTDLSFGSGDVSNEFSKLSLGLNRLVNRIRADNKTLRSTVESLSAANRELKRNEKEMIRTEKLASVGRLSAGLAHEIGNPLGIIQGYVDMLGTSELTEQERCQFAQRAGSELERINTLILQLLDISRKVDREEKTVHVQHLLEEMVGLTSLERKNRQVEIITSLTAENDRASVDENQLRQVVLNCLMNAVDAIEEKGEEVQGQISVICENIFIEESEGIQIRIVDNGSGVEEADLENIFDPFFTTKETGKGTGLGLYVSYTIMDNLGGSIKLNNLDTIGAEIVIQLPCSKNDMNI